jgi:hypothetical protein
MDQYRVTVSLVGPNKDLIQYDIRDERGLIHEGWQVSLAHVQRMENAFYRIAKQAQAMRDKIDEAQEV